jgi:ketose-bisphosphate aldolase
MDSAAIMRIALAKHAVIPAFNIPYLPMVEPLVHALRDEKAFGFIAVARLEWVKFESGSMDAVRAEYEKHKDRAYVRLHLDHIPVIDEDGKRVPYAEEIAHALEIGYESVMVDGSRLSLEENIAATREAARIAHAAGRPVEAELGAVVGHESGPLPPYEELFASKKGFTEVEEARRFALESECDWLSVAIGNIHGAIAEGLRDQKKPAARLDLEHLSILAEATKLPLVLHGGSGIPEEYVREAINRGIAKINIGTELRQAYLSGSNQQEDVAGGQEAVYRETRRLLSDRLKMSGSADLFK